MNQEFAIRCCDVRKTYRLYESTLDMALDRVGFGRYVERRRGRPVRTKDALLGLDLSVRKGERVGIIGRNGAGKTTLLKLIAGAAAGTLAPTSGQIHVEGRVQALLRTADGFHPDLSGEENARFALAQEGLSGASHEAALLDIAEFAELGLFWRRPFKTYSLGMGARLQFAVATAVDAEILIVDEVLGAGDAYFLSKSADRMRHLVGSGRTLLFVSHSIEQVLLYADRIVWIHEGRVVQDGPAAEIAAAYAVFSTTETAAVATEPARERAFSPPVPAHVRSKFVQAAIARAEGMPPEGTWVELPSGLQGLRRNAPGAAAIVDIRTNAVTTGSDILHVADTVRLSIDIQGMQSTLRAVIEVFALNGAGMTRIIGPRAETIDSAITTIIAELSPSLLGAREYLLSVSIEQISDGFTLDRLSQVIYLPFANINDTGPPFMHHPALWFFGSSTKAVPARLKAEI